MHGLNAQTKVELCKTSIYIDVIKSGIPHLEASFDTVIISEGEAYYLRLLLKSCKGAMYLERYHKANNNLIFSGQYMDAVKLDTVEAWAVDPMTGDRSPRKATHYRPLRTGVWKYYGDKGELLKEEEYQDGNLVVPKK